MLDFDLSAAAHDLFVGRLLLDRLVFVGQPIVSSRLVNPFMFNLSIPTAYSLRALLRNSI